MKLEIWNEGNKNPPRYLRLCDISANTIVLAVCDEEGDAYPNGMLLEISKETGRVMVYTAINRTFGLDLDESGRVKVKLL